ncbi:MAG: hypothetical protein ACXVR1_07570 [Solirubrobacteraceae bacterium]
MSSEGDGMGSRTRWRALVTGAVAGLVVAAAIVGPSALASGGQSGGTRAQAKAASANGCAAAATAKAAHAAGGPDLFLAAVAQLVQAGTITAGQGQVVDAQIRAGSIDPEKLVSSGALSAAQMQAVTDRLSAIKRRLASQQQVSSSSSKAAGPKAAG